jgi:chromosome segregation ATPase
MSQSLELKSEMETLATLASQMSDNPQLQNQLDLRVESLSRSIAHIEEMEAREAAKTTRMQALADKLTTAGKRIDDISAEVTSSTDEKRTFKDRLVAHLGSLDSDDHDAVLAQYDYLKGKGLTKKQIRLVLGI